MNFPSNKQPSLKPQDLLVTIKLAIHPQREFTYAELASELSMSISEVHAAVKRAEVSRLISKSGNSFVANRSALLEFLLHGVQYTFPAIRGTLTRGMPTGFASPSLQGHFLTTDELPPVWPDSEGEARGTSLQPIYRSVPNACRTDNILYEVLTLVDVLRSGSAREREFAGAKIMELLK